MNSAYVVGATFTIEDLASPTLGKLAGQLEKLDTLIEGVKTNLKTLVPSTLTGQITKVGAAFDALPAQADKAALGMIVAMDRANLGLAKSADAMRVGFDATFVGLDAAANKASSGMIAAMAKAETGVSASATAMKGNLGGVFAGMDVGLTAATDVITSQFSRITRSANRSSRAIGKLRGELSGLSTMSNLPLPQLPGMGGGRGGSGGGGGHRRPGQSSGGFHMAPEAMNTPVGRVSGHGLAGAAIAGAVIVGDAVLTAAELEDFVTKIIITSQLQPGEQPLTKNADGQKIKDLIQKGAIISGFSQEKVGEMFLGAEREFQGLLFDKKLDTIGALLPAIAAEAHLRHESLEEAGVSLVGVLHQAGLFSKEDMLKGAKEFQFTTMATPVGLGQFKNALSYTMTPLHGGLGMDTGTIMLLTSLMQSAGISNSKAGTWSRQMFVEAEPSTDVLGPLTKTQVQHNKALSMLGLIGSDGKQNWKVQGEDGKTDWNASVIKMFRELGQGMASIPEGERADVLHRAFGTQGAGAATLFSQPNIIDQMEILVPKLKAFQGGDVSLQEYSQGSTIQQSRIAMQEFQVLMADLGTTLLPPINSVLKEVSADLKALPADWEATKRMWGFRVDSGFDAVGDAAKVLGKIPGLGAPFRDTSKPAFDPNEIPASGFVPMAWDGGSSGGVSGAEDTIYRGTLRAFTDFAAGKTVYGGSGGGGGGGGFQNASWGGGEGFGGGGGAASASAPHNMRYGPSGHTRGGGGGSGGPSGLTALPHGAVSGTILSRGDDAMAHLQSLGVTREAAAAIVGNAQQESSITGHGPLGDTAKFGFGDAAAHGMFQWREDRFVALRNFARARGKPWQDEHTELEFMVDEAKKRGNSGWLYGHDVYAANQGMKRFEQYGESRDGGNFRTRLGNANMWNGRHGSAPVTAFKPPRTAPAETTTNGRKAGANETSAMNDTPIIIHNHTHLDGRRIASSTMKHFAQAGRFPTGMGGVDGHSHYSNGAGTPVVDAA